MAPARVVPRSRRPASLYESTHPRSEFLHKKQKVTHISGAKSMYLSKHVSVLARCKTMHAFKPTKLSALVPPESGATVAGGGAKPGYAVEYLSTHKHSPEPWSL
jgi:hypothetical protein